MFSLHSNLDTVGVLKQVDIDSYRASRERETLGVLRLALSQMQFHDYHACAHGPTVLRPTLLFWANFFGRTFNLADIRSTGQKSTMGTFNPFTNVILNMHSPYLRDL